MQESHLNVQTYEVGPIIYDHRLDQLSWLLKHKLI